MFLEPKVVEVRQNVAFCGVLTVPEEMLASTVAIGPSQVTSCNLLQYMSHVQRLQDGQVGGLQRVLLPQVLYEGRPRKAPL